MERRVLVIYTGGTIGMVKNHDGALEPNSEMFLKRIRQCPKLHDTRKSSAGGSTLIMPGQSGEASVCYWIHEMRPLLDSSNMGINDWMKMAKVIEENYENYDGFVVLHGTDTLAYTASALSFMLENLGKTVVVTGSQVPISEEESDGLHNFRASVLISANHTIPEVTIFFDEQLFRGNRTVKVSSINSVGAFDSPNMKPLGFFGTKFTFNSRHMLQPNPVEKFVVHGTLNANVTILKIFPMITPAMVESALAAPTEGVILETYGAGNIPDNRTDVVAALASASARGVLLVNCTQCFKGSVHSIYATNQALVNAGVISGHDLTTEAALTKLSYVLSKKEWDYATKCIMMERSIRGELTNADSIDYNDNTVSKSC